MVDVAVDVCCRCCRCCCRCCRCCCCKLLLFHHVWVQMWISICTQVLLNVVCYPRLMLLLMSVVIVVVIVVAVSCCCKLSLSLLLTCGPELPFTFTVCTNILHFAPTSTLVILISYAGLCCLVSSSAWGGVVVHLQLTNSWHSLPQLLFSKLYHCNCKYIREITF